MYIFSIPYFHGVLISAVLDKLDDAIAFKNEQRNQPPALYNPARLREKPIPFNDEDEQVAIAAPVENVAPIENVASVENGEPIENAGYVFGYELDSDEEDFGLTYDFESDDESVDTSRLLPILPPILPVEEVVVTTDNSNARSENSGEVDPLQIDVKREMYFEATERDQAELNQLLAEQSEDEEEAQTTGENIEINAAGNNENNAVAATSANDSDIEIVFVGPGGFPRPQGFATESFLTKQENDSISGKLPYAPKVNVAKYKLYFVCSLSF